MPDEDQIPWTTIQDQDREVLLIPGTGLVAWVAAKRCLLELGRDNDLRAMNQELRETCSSIIERYVHVRGTGAILEGDHDS